MKTHRITGWVAALAAVGLGVASASAAGMNALAVGARYHVASVVLPELPYDDGDLSYGVAYELHEENAFWQLAVSGAPELNGNVEADYVITPELNLILKDRMFRGGVGIMDSYVETPVDSEWTDLYYQLILGLSAPIRKVNVAVYAYYPFADWDKLNEFDWEDVEFGVWLSMGF